MSSDHEDGTPGVDARGARGVQIGRYNVQVNVYAENTWTAGVPQRPIAVGVSPYRGLTAFEEKDEQFFFGRDAAVDQVLRKMAQSATGAGVLVVSGVSGAGKSSLLRAGLLPRIRREGLAPVPGAASWPCLLFTPGSAPLDELAVQVAVLAGVGAADVRRSLGSDPENLALFARQAVLARGRQQVTGAGRLLLIIDQFEQLFTQCPSEGQREAYITALHSAVTGQGSGPSALVVLAVRADFEARCADYPQLAEAVQDRYLLTAMTRHQLRLAITMPARKAGSSVDEDLVDMLLDEARARPAASSPAGAGAIAGALPLLSHALDQAWRSRVGHALTLSDYERSGGIEAAVAKSADAAFGLLTPAQQATARQVFLDLTVTSPDGQDTAARVAPDTLTEDRNEADVRAVLDAFADARLLILADGSVEISHEVVLTAWPLLRDTWLAEARSDRIIQGRLRQTAREWADSGRDPSYLYRGLVLRAATEAEQRIRAAPASRPRLTPDERDFLEASVRASRRRTRQLQTVAVTLTVLLVALGAVTAAVVRASREATSQRDSAVASLLNAESEDTGDANPVTARQEAVAAWQLHPSDQSRYAMLKAAALPGIAVLSTVDGAVAAQAFSPDGKTLVTGSATANDNIGALRFWSTATHLATSGPLLVPGGGAVASLAFSPDGKTVAVGIVRGNLDNGDTQLWDAATHRRIATLLAHGQGSEVKSVAFSPDGRLLAVAVEPGDGGVPGGVQLWDVASRQPLGGPLAASSFRVAAIAFSPDGSTLAVSYDGGDVTLWNVATGHQKGSLSPGLGAGSADALAFDPDGRVLAAATADGVQLWNPATEHLSTTLTPDPGSLENLNSLAFSPDGVFLAVGVNQGTAQLWDVPARHQVSSPLAADRDVQSVAFSPDGGTLAVGSPAGTALWSVPELTGYFPGSLQVSDPGKGIAISPNGRMLVAVAQDGRTRTFNLRSRRLIGTVTTVTGLQPSDPAISPDGNTVAIATETGVKLCRLSPGVSGCDYLYPTDNVTSLAFSPDGKTLAVGENTDQIQLFAMPARRLIRTVTTTTSVESLAYSPDGKLLTAVQSETVQLWHAGTMSSAGTLTTSSTPDAAAFSRDGTLLAVATQDGSLLWSPTTHPSAGLLLPSSSPVIYNAFSPDGTVLVAVTADATQLWDTRTLQLVATLPDSLPQIEGYDSDPWGAALSPDGSLLAIETADGTFQMWDVSYLAPARTPSYICAQTGQPLTRAQWKQYTQGIPYRDACP